MKVLLDTCIWGPAKRPIAEAGHDVTWTGDLDVDPGDSAILQQAVRENRVLVTLDKDFGALAVRDGRPHCGIIRLVDVAARRQGPICVELFESHKNELQLGAILTVEENRVRVRVP